VYCTKEKANPKPSDALKRRIVRTMVSKTLGLGMLISSDSVHYQLKRIAGEELLWLSSAFLYMNAGSGSRKENELVI
jgi:hypothetical protein